MTVFTAAVLQMRSGLEPEANVAALEALVAEAVASGANYLQSPEMTGMVQRDRAELMQRLRGEDDDLVLAAAARLARQHRVYLHVGSTAIALDDGKVANRAVLYAPDGTLKARYDKIHMFDVDLDNGESWRESRTYRPGERAALADLQFADGSARLGFAVCYDMRFPQLFREEALAGAEILTAPAAFTRQTGEAHWHVLLRARAIENGAYVIAAAQGGVH
jgi:predicted amidohydrolase